MQTWNYWEQFENTGRIEDYLSYKANISQLSDLTAGCKSDYRETSADRYDRLEEPGKEYAGINTGDGNCFETVPDGRI